MAVEWATILATSLTLALGWLLSEAGSWFKMRREERVREKQRLENKADQRAEFQRQTLLELQDTIGQLVRASGRLYHEDQVVYKKTGVWGKTRLSEEWSNKERDAVARMNILTVRVADEKIREMLTDFRDQCARLSIAQSEEEAGQVFMDAAESFRDVNYEMGVVIRSTY